MAAAFAVDSSLATELGSFVSFVALWVSMIAAMMLPGAVPAVSRFVRVDGRLLVAPLFVGSYLAVWTMVGLVVYALYQPHRTFVAGVLTVAAGVHELTPLKRGFRRRCRESVRSGFEFGIYCIGSSIGLMLMLLALGVMSIAWMGVVAAVLPVQKLLPRRAFIDAPFAVAIVVTGILVAVAPSGTASAQPGRAELAQRGQLDGGQLPPVVSGQVQPEGERRRPGGSRDGDGGGHARCSRSAPADAVSMPTRCA
jgi:predicted metal-binding membrane protein